MEDVHLEYRKLEGASIAHLTIDRARKLNVLNTDMMRKTKVAFDQLGKDEDLRAVVLSGAGDKAWVGGADIAEMANLNPDSATNFISTLHQTLVSIRDLPVPVIAKINGYALGGGMEMAAACDTRIATTRSKFGMPETRVGIPSVIEASLLPRLMGAGRAARLMLSAEIIDAERAYQWGFVEELVEPANLDSAVEALLVNICACGPLAVRAQKKLLRDWENLSPDAAAMRSISAFASAYSSDEPRIRMETFLAKK